MKLEIVIRAEPESEPLAQQLVERLTEVHGPSIFSTDGSTIDERIAKLLGERKLAVGESCTGGLLAGRLTDRPGASAYFAGGVVAYSNEAKEELLGVPHELLEEHGAVSAEAAEAMAKGAAERFGADYGLAVTGIAGPDGGTPDKPVGRVCFAARGRRGRDDGPLHRHSGRAPGCPRPLGDRRASPAAPEAGGWRGPRLNLRAFVALDLPPEFLEPLVSWREAAYRDRSDVRLPRPETLHVTLAFLGYQAERDVPRLEEVTFAAEPRAARLAARETRGVPPRRSRLHALDLADLDGTLGRWQADLSERLAASRALPAREAALLAARHPCTGEAPATRPWRRPGAAG